MKTDFNSIRNQEIKGKLVDREVFANVNQMTEYILNKGYEDDKAPFSWDDVENLYTKPERADEILKELKKLTECEGDTAEELFDNISDRLEQIEQDYESGKREKFQETFSAPKSLVHTFPYRVFEERKIKVESLIEEYNNLEDEPQEIYEWWLVSSYLCEKLKAKGQPVIEEQNIWGRCTTGQAILLDYVIGKIAQDMEILEGQKNEWK